MARIREAVDRHTSRLKYDEDSLDTDSGSDALSPTAITHKLGSSSLERPIASIELQQMDAANSREPFNLERKVRRCIAKSDAGKQLRKALGIRRAQLDRKTVRPFARPPDQV